jgi:hypothetical protein
MLRRGYIETAIALSQIPNPLVNSEKSSIKTAVCLSIFQQCFIGDILMKMGITLVEKRIAISSSSFVRDILIIN